MRNLFKQNHPKGLFLLFFVEMWERFSYYGMRALIVLYMVQQLMYSTYKAGTIYGLYTGFVYLTPLIGGYLADRYFGQRRCITAGGILMVTGLFMLAFGGECLFLPSLFLMICANGLIKSNISSILGLLYGNNNEKKDSGFTIFYMGINFGALLSPLICGTIAAIYGFEYGFASAGVGMLFGLILYKIFENKLLKDAGLKPSNKPVEFDNAYIEPIKDKEKEQLKSLLLLMLFTIPFWICFEQAGSSLTLFAEYATDRSLFGKEIPTGYFQSLNPLFIVTLAPLISIVWEFLRKRKKEPSSVEKFTIALFLMSVAYVVLTFAAYFSMSGKVSPLWLLFGYFIMTVSELCLSPIGLSLVSKLAPKRFLSLTMGGWFLTSFFGNLIAGFLGGGYGSVSTVKLFLLFAIFSGIAFLVLLSKVQRFNEFIKR